MFFCLQLHVLLLSMVAAAAAVLSICVDAVKMRLLWLSIICFIVVHAAVTDLDGVSVEDFS